MLNLSRARRQRMDLLLMPCLLLVAQPLRAAAPVREQLPAAARPAEQEPAAEEADAAAVEPADAGAQAEPDRWWIRGAAEEEARARAALDPDECDVDLRLFLESGFASPGDRFGGEVALGLWWDMDGVPDSATPSALSEIRQVDDPPLWLDVYSLAADYRSRGIVREARVGRQVVDRSLPLTLDGVSALLAPLPPYLELFAYGGRSVHFFELDAGLFEDWIAAVGVASRPLRDLRLELDYRFQLESSERVEGMVDHGYGLAAWYRWGEWLKARGYLRGIDDALAFAGGALRLEWPGQELGGELRLHAQTTELRELNELDNPYFLTLGPSRPYLRWSAELWKAVATSFGSYSLHLGSDGRHLTAGGESAFNRDFGRIYAMVQATDIVIDGPFVSLVLARHGERFDFAGHGVWAVSGGAGYSARAWRVEVGSAYDNYKYTYYQSVDEHQDVRTFYAEARVRPFGFLSLRARYSYESFAWDVHTLTFALAQSF